MFCLCASQTTERKDSRCEDEEEVIYETLDGPYLDDAFGQRLLSMLCDQCPDAVDKSKSATYTAEAMRVLRSLPSPTLAITPTNTSSVVTADDQLGELLADTTQELKDLINNMLRLPANPPADKTLNIYYNATGGLEARVAWVGSAVPTPTDVEAVNAVNDSLKQGGRPPYIRMSPDEHGNMQVPSEEQTAKLFRLCEEQTFAFRIIAQALRWEIAEHVNASGAGAQQPCLFLPPTTQPEQRDRRQLLMVLLGGAGG